MDIATGLGLFAGGVVLVALILMGGKLGMFADSHAAIVIFGGAAAATLIRFPLSSIFHGLPLGMKFAFTMRRWTPRELVDEIARLAEIARKQGPIGLEKEQVEDPFLAKGMRFIAGGYDQGFSATTWSATAISSSPISTKARSSTARSATALRRLAWSAR